MPSPSPIILSIAKHAIFKYTMALWDRICSLIAFIHWFCWVLSPKDRIFHPPYPRLLSLILPTELPQIVHWPQTEFIWRTRHDTLEKFAKVSDERQRNTLSIYQSGCFTSSVSFDMHKSRFSKCHTLRSISLKFNLILYLLYGPVVVNINVTNRYS